MAMTSAAEGIGIEVIAVGGYTAEADGRARGIQLFRPGPASPDEIELVGLPGLVLASPTYVIAHPEQPWLFAVGETSPGTVSSISLSGDTLKLINTVPSGGDGGCHLSLDPSGGFLAVAHYLSGSVASFAIGDDGSLSEAVDVLQFSGAGPNPERQDRPHPHQVVSDHDCLLVPDLGCDLIRILTIDGTGRMEDTGQPLPLPAGAGPRHLVVIGDYLVVACELNATVWYARRAHGGWKEMSALPTSAAQAGSQPVYPSAIRVDGDRIFVANRGPNTIGVFELSRTSAELRRLAEFPCGGAWPRDLALSERHLWVANQDGDNVCVFDRTGALDPPDLDFEIPSPSPACILLVPSQPSVA
jgi:6-phosphogluconolactonase